MPKFYTLCTIYMDLILRSNMKIDYLSVLLKNQ